MALRWADGTPSSPLPGIGGDPFLVAAAARDAAGLAAMLTGPDAADPLCCASAWRLALGRPPGEWDGAVRLWLDTAAARPELRPSIVDCFAQAAGGDRERRRRVVGAVRAWGSRRPDRKGVEEDVLIELLPPGWKRWFLLFRLRARLAFGGL